MCIICLEANGQKIKCKCSSEICVNCMDSYIDYCFNEQIIPKCPECNKLFLYSDIKNDKKEQYIECCYNYLMRNESSVINDHMIILDILRKVKIERVSFIEKNMPKSIQKIISIALKKKINTISQSNKKDFEESIKKNSKKCIMNICTGKLVLKNDNESIHYICTKCDNIFCNVCEKMITNKLSTHICNKDDVESLQAIAKFIKCPKCNIPIQKSEGCNYMTCAICNINFDYITGSETIHGNHGVNTNVNVDNTFSLVQLYKDKNINASVFNIIKDIENNKPVINTTSVNNILFKLKDQSNALLKKKLAIEFEKLIIEKEMYKKYINYISIIEDMLSTNKIDTFKLRIIKAELSPKNNKSINFLFYLFCLMANSFPNEIDYPENLKIKLLNYENYRYNTENYLQEPDNSNINFKDPESSIIQWLMHESKLLYIEQFPSIHCREKYIVYSDQKKEYLFRGLKSIHGSFFAFYGTNSKNLFNIIQNGISVFSNTGRMINGSLNGPGICVSLDSDFAFSMTREPDENSTIALCEIVNDTSLIKKSGTLGIVVKSEEIVVMRYIFVGKFPKVSSIFNMLNDQ